MNYHGSTSELLTEVTKKKDQGTWPPGRGLKPEPAEYEERVHNDDAKSFKTHSKKEAAYFQPESSQKPNNRNRMYSSSSTLSHRCSKKNKWLPYSNCKLCNTIRTQLPWEGTLPVDVNKSRRHIKRSNTRTTDVRVASSRKRTFSSVACV